MAIDTSTTGTGSTGSGTDFASDMADRQNAAQQGSEQHAADVLDGGTGSTLGAEGGDADAPEMQGASPDADGSGDDFNLQDFQNNSGTAEADEPDVPQSQQSSSDAADPQQDPESWFDQQVKEFQNKQAQGESGTALADQAESMATVAEDAATRAAEEETGDRFENKGDKEGKNKNGKNNPNAQMQNAANSRRRLRGNLARHKRQVGMLAQQAKSQKDKRLFKRMDRVARRLSEAERKLAESGSNRHRKKAQRMWSKFNKLTQSAQAHQNSTTEEGPLPEEERLEYMEDAPEEAQEGVEGDWKLIKQQRKKIKKQFRQDVKSLRREAEGREFREQKAELKEQKRADLDDNAEQLHESKKNAKAAKQEAREAERTRMGQGNEFKLPTDDEKEAVLRALEDAGRLTPDQADHLRHDMGLLPRHGNVQAETMEDSARVYGSESDEDAQRAMAAGHKRVNRLGGYFDDEGGFFGGEEPDWERLSWSKSWDQFSKGTQHSRSVTFGLVSEARSLGLFEGGVEEALLQLETTVMKPKRSVWDYFGRSGAEVGYVTSGMDPTANRFSGARLRTLDGMDGRTAC